MQTTAAISSELTQGRQWLAGEPRVSRLAGGGVRVVAPGKVNLTLWVGPVREDGYHEVESVVAWISLADRLTVCEGGQGCELACNNPELACDGSNLVIRAAKALGQRVGRKVNLRMYLDKTIPMGAGLGGGSSDAAACLLALNDLWNLDYSNERLGEIAARIGSDVPLFLADPMCVLAGRGERTEPLGFDWPFWAVLVTPGTSLGTAGVYEKFDQLLTARAGKATIDRCQFGLCKPEAAGELMFNMLEPAALALLPELASWRESLWAAGAGHVQLCGSGSSLVCLLNSLSRARRLVERLGPQLRSWSRIVHGGHR